MKCFSNHASSFAIIAENITIDPTITTDSISITGTTATTSITTTVITNVSASMKVADHVYMCLVCAYYVYKPQLHLLMFVVAALKKHKSTEILASLGTPH